MATRIKGIEELLRSQAPMIEAEFMAAISSIRDTTSLRRLQDAITNRDIAAAVELLRVESPAFNAYLAAVKAAYDIGGGSIVPSLPRIPSGPRAGDHLLVRFDGRSLDAEEWLRRYSSDKIVQIMEDQRNAIRAAIEAGLARGDNPRTIALDIIGRIDPRTGKRVGSIIGLTTQQEGMVQRALEELTSGPDGIRAFMQRKLRDERFDRTLLKAINGEITLTDTQIAQMVAEYKDNMLQLRAETIARTEAMAALHAGRHEAITQAMASGDLTADEVTKVWSATGDQRTRESHMEMDGQTVKWGESYTTPTGAVLQYPGDPAGPAEEVINCRCDEFIQIDFIARGRAALRGT